MLYILIGTLGFVGFLLFDILSLNEHRILKYGAILLGISILVWSTISVMQLHATMEVPLIVRYISFVLAVGFFILLIYSVFIEVGLKTYGSEAKHKLITDGTYSLVRHPGVIWLFLLYFFLALFLNNYELLLAAFIFTAVNTLYIMIQERWILSKIFHNYDVYVETTPMVIPNLRSIRKFMTPTNWRKQ